MRVSMDEECDNICRLSCFVVSRVLTDWQAALLYVHTYPYAAHVMVRPLPCHHANPPVSVQINFPGMLSGCAGLSCLPSMVAAVFAFQFTYAWTAHAAMSACLQHLNSCWR